MKKNDLSARKGTKLEIEKYFERNGFIMQTFLVLSVSSY